MFGLKLEKHHGTACLNQAGIEARIFKDSFVTVRYAARPQGHLLRTCLNDFARHKQDSLWLVVELHFDERVRMLNSNRIVNRKINLRSLSPMLQTWGQIFFTACWQVGVYCPGASPFCSCRASRSSFDEAFHCYDGKLRTA